MISNIWHIFFYDPLYNGLIYLISIVPFFDVGIAIIILTIFVKLVLFPISKKAVRTQMIIKRLEPELNEIKKKFKKDKKQQGQKVMELYKKNNVNPFSGILIVLLQIPIILGLYWVFFRGGLPEINTDLLYSFISLPQEVNMNFLGLVNISEKNIIIALFAGITQYFQIKLTLPQLKKKTSNPTFKDDLKRSMHLQMRYVMPIMVFVFAYIISAAIALYWLTSNLFAIGQELFIRRKIKERSSE